MMICASILPAGVSEALSLMQKAWETADLVELRLDRIGSGALDRLMAAKRGPVLVTNRKKSEGGLFAGTEAQRICDLKRAVSLGADMIDIELSAGAGSISDLVRHIEQNGGRTRLVVSWHDFTGTPTDRVLRGKVSQCARAGADTIKIVTLANRMEDNLRVLSLIPLAAARGCGAVAFCMGRLGRVSRVAGPFLGAAFTFGSLEPGAETAPGQMTVSELKRIFSALADREKT